MWPLKYATHLSRGKHFWIFCYHIKWNSYRTINSNKLNTLSCGKILIPKLIRKSVFNYNWNFNKLKTNCKFLKKWMKKIMFIYIYKAYKSLIIKVRWSCVWTTKVCSQIHSNFYLFAKFYKKFINNQLIYNNQEYVEEYVIKLTSMYLCNYK